MGESIIQRSCAGGEVAPAVYGRADVVKYQTGLATCRNNVVRRHGGVSNRPGTGYITPQGTHSAKGRIWKFVFNADQTYILLFENQTLRFVRNGALITVSGVAAYNGATGYTPGDLVASGGVNYYCIANTTGNAPPNATYWYAMPTGNIYEIPTPYLTADLPTLYFSQSADVITITHPSYANRDLSRFGHTDWTLTLSIQAPSISAPGSLAVSGAAGTVSKWVATAIKAETLDESVPSAEVGSSAKPTTGAPRTLTIGAVSGAQEYNVYRHDGNGVFGYVGTAFGTTFIDDGITPNYQDTAPAARDPFSGSGNYPAISGYAQQRKFYGGSNNAPEDLHGSKTGQYTNFTRSSPLRDDDAVIYTPAAAEVNTIRHVLEIGEVFLLTSGAEWVLFGNGEGALTPETPGMKKQSSYGSAQLPPVVIGNSFIFLQARGAIVRDIKFEVQSNGYSGRDLTVFAPHFFDGYTLVHWDWAQIPHSVLWAVRSDGILLGLTYLRDHEIWGWHWHDTDGEFEDVCVVPEGTEDAVYVLVKRTIDGTTKRYLERFASRQINNLAVDAKFMDSHLTYDGRHTGSTTMTLSGGVDWFYTETLTLTASAGFFVSGDVGNTIVLTIETETYDPEEGWTTETATLTCTITAYTSTTVVSVNANKTVPVAFRNVAITVWAKGVDEFSGLDHLEGKTVSILADGHVVTNGITEPTTVVTGGAITLDRCYTVVHVGLPYCSDLQTLDLEVIGGETLVDKKLQVNQVTLLVEASRGIWAGNDADHLFEYKQRDPGDQYGMIEGITGKVEISMSSAYNKSGRVFVRQRDPLPLTILASIPSVVKGG